MHAALVLTQNMQKLTEHYYNDQHIHTYTIALCIVGLTATAQRQSSRLVVNL